jgi:hypothetical protein
MADARQVAEDFFDAWTGRDFERARRLLHDDVSFEGPIDHFSDADSYLASLRNLSGIVTGADKRKVFVDGDDVRVVPGARRQDRVSVSCLRRAAVRAAVRGPTRRLNHEPAAIPPTQPPNPREGSMSVDRPAHPCAARPVRTAAAAATHRAAEWWVRT